jgi:flagellin-like protein
MQGRSGNKNRENAVSEVIGAVMLIAVVVTAIADRKSVV